MQSSRVYLWRDCIKHRVGNLGLHRVMGEIQKDAGKKSTEVRSCKSNRLIDVDPQNKRVFKQKRDIIT